MTARALAILAALALPLGPTATAQGQSTTGVGSQFELTFWQSVESGNDPALYEAYLAQYPNGTFAAVARLKLSKLRQVAAPAGEPAPIAASAQIAPPPASAAPSTPAPAALRTPPIVPAIVPATAPVAAPSQPAPAPQLSPARTQVAAAKAIPAALPTTAPVVRERIAGPAPAPRPAPRPDAADGDDTAPYVTAAPPVESAGENADSAALRKLLGALGDSQRTGAPPPSPIVEATEAAEPEAAPLATAAPAPAPMGAPGAAAPRLVEVSGPPVAVPDAAALSATATALPDAHPIAVGPLPAGFALPPRPQLLAIPPLAFPPSFCSAEARNAFHDGPYVTAVETAKRNNDTAIAYMHQLQDLYDSNQLSGDINPMNAVAAEARAYGPVAAAAFAAQSTLVSAFSTLMAVPITPCEAPKQP